MPASPRMNKINNKNVKPVKIPFRISSMTHNIKGRKYKSLKSTNVAFRLQRKQEKKPIKAVSQCVCAKCKFLYSIVVSLPSANHNETNYTTDIQDYEKEKPNREGQ